MNGTILLILERGGGLQLQIEQFFEDRLWVVNGYPKDDSIFKKKIPRNLK